MRKVLDKIEIASSDDKIKMQLEARVTRGDILYLPVSSPKTWEERVTAEIIRSMTFYSPCNGQIYCD